MVALVDATINLLIRKKNGSFNGALDAALEDALYGGRNVALEGETLEFEKHLKMYKKVPKRIHSTSNLMVHLSLSLNMVSAVAGTLDDSCKGTPTFEA